MSSRIVGKTLITDIEKPVGSFFRSVARQRKKYRPEAGIPLKIPF
jgi:hypothetical protein